MARDVEIQNLERYRLWIGDVPNRWDLRISALALNCLDRFLQELQEATGKEKLRLLEFGSGVSTVWWAETFPDMEIYSVEGNKEWYERVKGWLKERNIKNVTLVFQEQTNFYTTENVNNMNYIYQTKAFNPPFDLIINDGGMREIVGDFILENADEYIAEGGLYLRHDYEMAVLGNWRGFHLEPLKPWLKDEKSIGYDQFCATHSQYELMTLFGNGLPCFVLELGGIWRKMDFKWERKMKNVNT